MATVSPRAIFCGQSLGLSSIGSGETMRAEQVRAAIRDNPNVEFAVKTMKGHRDPTFVRVRGLSPAGPGQWRYAEATSIIYPDRWRAMNMRILSSRLETIEDAERHAEARRQRNATDRDARAVAEETADQLNGLGVEALAAGRRVILTNPQSILDLLERSRAGNTQPPERSSQS